MTSSVSSERPRAVRRWDQLLVVDFEEQHGVEALTELAEHRFELPGLAGGAGEPVEQKPRRRVLTRQPLPDHRHGDLVGHQIPGVHVELGRHPELGPAPHMIAEQVPGGDVRRAQTL